MATEGLIRAAGYIRESTKMQRKGFGADVQRENIEAYAPTKGCYIEMWRDDTAQGHKKDRKGYQEIIAAVRAGTIHAVIVNMFDRAGRDGLEFVAFAEELDKRRVPLYSVTQGQLAGDGMAFIHAFMHRQEVITLARRVRPAKEQSVRKGQHIGITPFGYKRVYPEHEGASRYIPGLLVANEPAASVVRELFARAALGWTMRALAAWMNDNPECPPAPKGGAWAADRVGYILHNPAYHGAIRYNAHSVGRYDQCGKGTEFVVEGRHEALIAKGLFDRVQASIGAARKHDVRTRIKGPLPIASGLLVCPDCGGPMTISRRQDGHSNDQYVCCRHKMGAGSSAGAHKSYLASVAHDALLAQVGRLQGCPWNPRALDLVVGQDLAAEDRAQLQAQLQVARAEQVRHVRRYATASDDLSPEEVAVFREIGQEIQGRIDALTKDLADLPSVVVTAFDLQAIHRELDRVPLGDIVRDLVAIGDAVALRALLLKLVDSARVVDRVPDVRSTWARVVVTWAPDVRVLLEAGLLALAPDVDRPDYPATVQAQQRAKYLRYAARKKAGLV